MMSVIHRSKLSEPTDRTAWSLVPTTTSHVNGGAGVEVALKVCVSSGFSGYCQC